MKLLSEYEKYGKKSYKRNKKIHIARVIKWQKENSDKCKIYMKRYYDVNAKELAAKSLKRHNSPEGHKWFKKYYGSPSYEANWRRYYHNNSLKWDRYRYKWILKEGDLHYKNMRVAKLFVKRVNRISGHKIEKQDISINSNGVADVKIKTPNMVYVKRVLNKSVYWSENFNHYIGTKVNLKIKSKT